MDAISPNDQRIKETIDSWKHKLLDLSKRNRALNFKVNKISTIVIEDEQPAEIFRFLCLQGQSLRFKPKSEPLNLETNITNQDASNEIDTNPDFNRNTLIFADDEVLDLPLDPETNATKQDESNQKNNTNNEIDASNQTDTNSTPNQNALFFADDEELDFPILQVFVPYDQTGLSQTESVLQTAATPEALDKSLRRLDEQARTAIEEQGVNPLFLALGMLYYKEAAQPQEILKAPLILVPVELSRNNARTGFHLKAADHEPIVNPALVEYLRRLKIALPELPETGLLDETYDLQTFFQAASEAIQEQAGWAIQTEIHLGLFSFEKFAMYRDLETNSSALASHRLIQRLITRAGQLFLGLPEVVRSMDLDKEFAPENTSQVVDADSSQLRAIAAVSRGYDLVLEGPPGTGKSQTITNLIAQAFSQGKSVLFVAEKKAAVDVVYNRLVQAGLGEFCLDLHSRKANKLSVMKDLAATLDVSSQHIAPTISTQGLPVVRASLDAYVQALHAPYGALGQTPFRGYGELGKVLDAPKAQLSRDISQITEQQLDDTARDLQDLAITAEAIFPPSAHPWRNTTKTFYSQHSLETISALTENLLEKLDELTTEASKLEEAYSMPAIKTFDDVETSVSIATVFTQSPGAPLSVLQNEAWNSAPPEATALVARGRKCERLSKQLLQKFKPETLEHEHADDIAYIEQKAQGIFSFLAFLNGRYRAIKKRWLSYRLPSYRGGLLEQMHDMKTIVELRSEQRELNAQNTTGQQLFGALWRGENSSWDALERYIAWVVQVRGLCVRFSLRQRALEIAAQPSPDMTAVQALNKQVSDVRPLLAQLCQQIGWPNHYFSSDTIEAITARVREINVNIALAPRWTAFEAARQKVFSGLAGELLPAAMNGQITFNDLKAVFFRALYQKWLSVVVQEREPLRTFNSLTHTQRLKEFQNLDERVLEENRVALINKMRDTIREKWEQPEFESQKAYLQGQMARQRGHRPLRQTMKLAEAAIRAVKPCFMMSPLSVAQLLDGSQPSFDLVIFDEASQLPPEDAVGAILRGKQLAVIGDSSQLPPTNFFEVTSGQVNALYDEEGVPIYEDAESILELFAGLGLPKCRLKWHYRSTHESLIAFSNNTFYDTELYTFPSVETDNVAVGLKFKFVPGGVYEGKGLNLIEARHVADAVVRHAKMHPELSLGVGTFNLRQQIAIQDELELRRRRDPSIEPFFARDKAEAFFVKNLENIQGDERDVIFLSVTYAKGRDGVLHYNFGPLNRENGWRRMNVLTTRARRQMRVFSSITSEDINTTATTARGALLLRDFLLYAEHRRLNSVNASLEDNTESAFERDVFNELTRRGISLVPQVGVSGYRIDLGVLDDDVIAGKYICGIECDGVTYSSSETACDRDRLRQQVLEDRGWTIHRVWSTDWFKDRTGQIERLMNLIEESRKSARERQETEHETTLATTATADEIQAETENKFTAF